jgi:hypothetical protein
LKPLVPMDAIPNPWRASFSADNTVPAGQEVSAATVNRKLADHRVCDEVFGCYERPIRVSLPAGVAQSVRTIPADQSALLAARGGFLNGAGREQFPHQPLSSRR